VTDDGCQSPAQQRRQWGNVSKLSSTQCSSHVRQFVESNNLSWLDVFDCECDYTYHNDVSFHYSLLDYFVVSSCMVNVPMQ